jgi:hypothetical protein
LGSGFFFHWVEFELSGVFIEMLQARINAVSGCG